MCGWAKSVMRPWVGVRGLWQRRKLESDIAIRKRLRKVYQKTLARSSCLEATKRYSVCHYATMSVGLSVGFSVGLSVGGRLSFRPTMLRMEDFRPAMTEICRIMPCFLNPRIPGSAHLGMAFYGPSVFIICLQQHVRKEKK